MTFMSDRLAQNQAENEEKRQKANHQTPAKSEKAEQAITHAKYARFAFDVNEIMAKLSATIVGQGDALQQIEQMLTVVKADFNPKDKPLSVTLMLGPTGVGKTETVRIISEAIYGNANAFCRIDMNTLAQEHYSAALTGAPPGYVGSKEGNTLFNLEAIAGSFSKPGIVLFDEIEKASNEVIRALLNVLDTGKLTLTSGTKAIDFSNCMIFMTSNVGARASQIRLEQLNKLPATLQSLAGRLKLDETTLVQKALERKFDPEFINRIERILAYQKINDDQIPKLIDIELDKLNARLSKKDHHVQLTNDAVNYLADGYDVRYGARGLGRKIRTELEPLLASWYLAHPDDGTVIVDACADGLCIA
ncbi:AAA family ATPase [Moraxella nasovis]|uniref:AAA family ATPase n=1 Tax=Moraxella nasovis TaxID=2904121 RepID=UPI001F61E484|nr:AAA family ATPase [Moraxella nasovis]UNU73995.1 AAA family ATPase [Moraxella nasovis]